jgi:hypothetical protein
MDYAMQEQRYDHAKCQQQKRMDHEALVGGCSWADSLVGFPIRHCRFACQPLTLVMDGERVLDAERF